MNEESSATLLATVGSGGSAENEGPDGTSARDGSVNDNSGSNFSGVDETSIRPPPA